MRLIDADTIKYTHAIARSIDDGHNWNELCVTQDEIEDMPTIQPKRIKGHWIDGESQCGIKCSKCGCPVDDFCHSIDYIDLDYAPNFCPNCGSDNREVTT